MRVGIKSDIVGVPVNVGSGQGTPILKLAERILSVSETSSQLDHQPARGIEVKRFVAQVDRMKSLLALDPPADPLDQLEALYHIW